MDPLKNLGLERVRMEEDDRYVDVYYAGKVEAVIAGLMAAADFARWRDCVDGRPGDDYFKHRYDWVLVKAREKCTGYNIELPYIAEYGRISGKWHFRDTQRFKVFGIRAAIVAITCFLVVSAIPSKCTCYAFMAGEVAKMPVVKELTSDARQIIEDVKVMIHKQAER